MKNAIVILNYNDSSTTIKLVEQIKNYKKLDRIIITDNCSSDNSYDLLYQKYNINKKIDIIRTENNNGYANGNNFGVYYAIKEYNADYVLIANPDILFSEDVIVEIENQFKRNSDIAVLAPLVSNGYNSWKLPNYSKILASMFLYLNKKFGNQVYKTQKEDINYVDVVAGSLFAIRSNVFTEINGFDNRTFLYYEENILAYKLRQKGYKSAILGNVRYDHCHAASIKKVYKSKLKLFKIISKSIKIYAYFYLNVNIFQKILMKFVYCFAYLERFLYDIYSRVIIWLGDKR